jgi:hypothetical protein
MEEGEEGEEEEEAAGSSSSSSSSSSSGLARPRRPRLLVLGPTKELTAQVRAAGCVRVCTGCCGCVPGVCAGCYGCVQCVCVCARCVCGMCMHEQMDREEEPGSYMQVASSQ